MMKSNGGGAGGEWAGIRTDHSLPQVRRLQALIPQVVFDEFGHRPIEQHMLRLLISVKTRFNLFPCRRLTDPHISVVCRPQSIAQPADHVIHGAPAFYITECEVANLLLASLIIIPKLNAGSIQEWNEQSIHRRTPLKTATGQIQF